MHMLVMYLSGSKDSYTFVTKMFGAVMLCGIYFHLCRMLFYVSLNYTWVCHGTGEVEIRRGLIICAFLTAVAEVFVPSIGFREYIHWSSIHVYEDRHTHSANQTKGHGLESWMFCSDLH